MDDEASLVSNGFCRTPPGMQVGRAIGAEYTKRRLRCNRLPNGNKAGQFSPGVRIPAGISLVSEIHQ